jgi:hypothetical protein
MVELLDRREEMSDPTVTSTAAGTVTGDNLAQVVAQAVAAAVTSSLNEISAKFNQMLDSLSERVKQTSANEDTNFEASVVGASDPFENDRRGRLWYDQVQQVALRALSNAVETDNMVSKQAVRHGDLAIDRQWNEGGERAGERVGGSQKIG